MLISDCIEKFLLLFHLISSSVVFLLASSFTSAAGQTHWDAQSFEVPKHYMDFYETSWSIISGSGRVRKTWKKKIIDNKVFTIDLDVWINDFIIKKYSHLQNSPQAYMHALLALCYRFRILREAKKEKWRISFNNWS